MQNEQLFIFNHNENTSAVSFFLPKKDDNDLLELVTLVGQSSIEVTNMNPIDYAKALSDYPNTLEIVDKGFLEVIKIQNNPELSDEEKTKMINDSSIIIDDVNNFNPEDVVLTTTDNIENTSIETEVIVPNDDIIVTTKKSKKG